MLSLSVMKDKYIFKCKTPDEEGTHDVGRALANIIKRGDVLLLTGDLAAGKTTMSRTLFAHRGYTKGFCSPTFAIINEYKNDSDRAYHMDLYRIQDAQELDYTGFYECLENGEFTVIEWPEIALGVIENDCIEILIQRGESFDERVFCITLYDKEQYDKLREELNAYSCD